MPELAVTPHVRETLSIHPHACPSPFCSDGGGGWPHAGACGEAARRAAAAPARARVPPQGGRCGTGREEAGWSYSVDLLHRCFLVHLGLADFAAAVASSYLRYLSLPTCVCSSCCITGWGVGGAAAQVAAVHLRIPAHPGASLLLAVSALQHVCGRTKRACMPDLLPSATGHTDAWLPLPHPLQNGSVAEAISLWKRNVDKEFEGASHVMLTSALGGRAVAGAQNAALLRVHRMPRCCGCTECRAVTRSQGDAWL